MYVDYSYIHQLTWRFSSVFHLSSESRFPLKLASQMSISPLWIRIRASPPKQHGRWDASRVQGEPRLELGGQCQGPEALQPSFPCQQWPSLYSKLKWLLFFWGPHQGCRLASRQTWGLSILAISPWTNYCIVCILYTLYKLLTVHKLGRSSPQNVSLHQIYSQAHYLVQMIIKKKTLLMEEAVY